MEKHFKILLATDYSEAVMNTERYAVQFAKAIHSTLTFLHVYEFPLSVSPSEPLQFSKTKSVFYKSELEKLEQHRDKLFRTLNINPDELKSECIVYEGNAGKQIRKKSQESNVDFIMIGTHGVADFRRVFSGSHTWDVIKKSSVPVLAIPKDALFTGIKNIVFATQYREGELPVISFLAEFAKEFNSELTILHVTNYILTKKFEAEMFEKFRKEVKNKISYPKLQICLAHYDDVIAGLNDFCVRTKSDLLVMSPEKPLFFNPIISETRKMSFHTHIPILAIPDYYNPEHSAFSETSGVNEEF